MRKRKKEKKVKSVGMRLTQRSDPHQGQRKKVGILCMTKHELTADA